MAPRLRLLLLSLLLVIICFLITFPDLLLSSSYYSNCTLLVEFLTPKSTLSPDPVLEVIPSCKNIAGPTSESDVVRWEVLRKVVTIFQAAGVPYYLTDGSLLMLVRECNLGTSDMDIAVDLDWWRKAGNQEKLIAAMYSIGLKPLRTFGTLSSFGYEEAWSTREGLKLDIFSTDVVVKGERRGGMWVNGVPYPCIVKVSSFVSYQWWDIQVRLPYPLEPALISMYGTDYTVRKPWRWATSPFETGYCRYNNSGLDWERSLSQKLIEAVF